MNFKDAMEAVGVGVEVAGVVIIIFGALYSTGVLALEARAHDEHALYVRYRRRLGRAIILGLEFLVAGDIIRTVTVRPTFEELGILAGIVAIRTFLAFALELEITGRLPWQHASSES